MYFLFKNLSVLCSWFSLQLSDYLTPVTPRRHWCAPTDASAGTFYPRRSPGVLRLEASIAIVMQIEDYDLTSPILVALEKDCREAVGGCEYT